MLGGNLGSLLYGDVSVMLHIHMLWDFVRIASVTHFLLIPTTNDIKNIYFKPIQKCITFYVLIITLH